VTADCLDQEHCIIRAYLNLHVNSMSGFEVAGVVLGVLPLVLEVLKGWTSTKKKYGPFFRRAKHCGRLDHALEAQMELLEVSLVTQLNAIGIDELPDSPSGRFDLLRRKDVADDLETHMGVRFNPFSRAMDECRSILMDIVQHIQGLLPDQQVSPSSQGGESYVKETPKRNSTDAARSMFLSACASRQPPLFTFV
jgi:hypothetical protein